MQLLWDDENLEHIARHGVDDIEFEDVLFDPERIAVEAYNTDDQERMAYIGKTESGRILFTSTASTSYVRIEFAECFPGRRISILEPLATPTN